MEIRKTISSWITRPLTPVMSRAGISPNVLTWTGLLITVFAAIAIALNYLVAGGVLLLIAGLFDMFDGAVARYANKITRFGALLDSTMDRLSEGIVLFGLLFLNLTIHPDTLEIYLIFGVLVTSFLISYIRARSEGLNIECKVGLFTRAERVIILALALIVNQVFIALIVLLVFTFITVVHRLIFVYSQTKRE